MLSNSPIRILAFVIALSSAIQPSLAQQGPQRAVGVKASTAGERRVALVIGNSRYKAGPLANPVNDAEGMAETLKSLGFEVLSGFDADRNRMMELIRQFGEKLDRKTIGLFYFAGHGVQIDDVNFLIPVDAEIKDEDEAKYKSVEAGYVLDSMRRAQNRVNIIILDACRNNPFPRKSRSGAGGLAKMDAPSGSIIAFATKPGQVASDGKDGNGLYTGELLKQLRKPGQSLTDVFMNTRSAVLRQDSNQEPWEHTSLTKNVYLNGLPNAVSAANLSPEQAHWAAIEQSDDPEDFRDYLAEYPSGGYAPAAQARLKQLASNKPQASEESVATRQVYWRTVKDESFGFNPALGWIAAPGVSVNQGERIEINASGRVNLGANVSVGPEGTDLRVDDSKPLASCQTGALIARVGSGDPVCVRGNFHFLAARPGQLEFRLNESNVKDNEGPLSIRIKVLSPFTDK
jgi:uncharacterized caspase-like protein